MNVLSRISALLFGVATLAVAADPSAGDRRRIYLANDDHTDYMWSADEGTYERVFIDLIDWHLRLADETAHLPAPFRNRFNPDGSHWLWVYERRKSEAEFALVIQRIKDGTLSVPLNTLVSCYGAQPVEAVLRGMYYAGRLERRFDLRFNLATAMENQTLPRGLASLFAGSGARYTWRGVCGCASRLQNKELGQRDHDIYWAVGPDGREQLMKWYSLGPHAIGGYWEAGFPEKAIAHVESDPGFRKRYSNPSTGRTYSVIGLFGYGGDDLARKTGVTPPPRIPAVPGLQGVPSSPYCDHFHVIAQRMTNAEREVVVSNQLDFFADFEAKYGANLPRVSLTYGNEWDLYSASMAETSARVKRAVEKLRAAELLAALVSLQYPEMMEKHVSARDEAFANLGLYWEHDWTADGPISRGQRAAWQEKVAAIIEAYVNSLHADGMIRLGGMIARPKDAVRFFVLNPLAWARSEAADYPYAGSQDVHVVDVGNGQPVMHQFISVAGIRSVRILAQDVPPAGYKVYEIRPGPSPLKSVEPAATAIAETGVFENERVRVLVERDGAIRSLIDKRDGTELAATIEGTMLNDLAANSTEGEALKIENQGPVSVTLRARSSAGVEHDSRITLYRHSDRVDIHNDITANFASVRHWAFSFNLTEPTVRSEEVGAINVNRTQSQGGHYADRNARYDYITVNHFADISQGGAGRGVTLSNPDLAFARLGKSAPAELDTTTPQINMLAGGQVDGSALGIRGQNGQRYFTQRFALRPHAGYDAVAAMRFALEHQNPLVAGPVISKETSSYPENNYSLLSVDSPGALVWAVKPSEEGIQHGLVVRTWNVSDAPVDATVRFTPTVNKSQPVTHIETPLAQPAEVKDSTLNVAHAPQQLQTILVQLGQPAK